MYSVIRNLPSLSNLIYSPLGTIMTTFKKMLHESMSEDQILLSESFNSKPYEVTMTKKGANDILFGFETEQGTEYQVRFRKSTGYGAGVRRVTVRQKQGSTFKDVVKKFDDPMRVMSTLIHSVEMFSKTPMGKETVGMVLDMSKKAAPRASKIFQKALKRNKAFRKFFTLVDTVAVSDEGQQTAWAVAKGKKPEDVFTGSEADGMLGDSTETSKEEPVVDPDPEPKAEPEKVTMPRTEGEAMWDEHGTALMRVIKKNPAYDMLKILGVTKPVEFRLKSQGLQVTFWLKDKGIFRWEFEVKNDAPLAKYNKFGAVLHGVHGVWDGTKTTDESQAEDLMAKAAWWYCMKNDWKNLWHKGEKSLQYFHYGEKVVPTNIEVVDGRYLNVEYQLASGYKTEGTIGRSNIHEFKYIIKAGYVGRPKQVNVERIQVKANKFANKYLKGLVRQTNSANDQQIDFEVWKSGGTEVSVALAVEQRGYPNAAESAVKGIVNRERLPKPSHYDSGQGDDSDYIGDHAYGRAVWVFREGQIHESGEGVSFKDFIKS